MTQISEQPVNENDVALMQHFNKTIAKQQLAHAYLFNGPKGADQKVMAKWLSMRLFCQSLIDGQPCGTCSNCIRIKQDEHLDVITIKSDKATIKVDAIRLLKQEFTKSAVESNHKILIIERADTMTVSAQNSLLKFIEEPLGNTLIMLLTENKNQLLPTIISRTQVVEFELPKLINLEQQLVGQGTAGEIRLALRLSGNLVDATNLLTSPALGKLNNLVWRWFNVLLQRDLAAFAMIQTGFIPLIQDSDTPITADQIFDAIMFIFRDLLLIDQQDTVVYLDNKEALQILSSKISSEQRLQFIELVLAARGNQQMNISLQSILEALTLEILLKLV